jgi:hypothetical protein
MAQVKFTFNLIILSGFVPSDSQSPIASCDSVKFVAAIFFFLCRSLQLFSVGVHFLLLCPGGGAPGAS